MMGRHAKQHKKKGCQSQESQVDLLQGGGAGGKERVGGAWGDETHDVVCNHI
jgi:hypothetical protein